MKRQLFILLVLLVAMCSCNWHTEPQYSPSIYGSFFYINPVFDGDSMVSAQDTITDLFYDADDDTYDLMDTIYIGDTVMFAAKFYTYNSDLVSVKIDWDKNHMDVWYFLTDSTKNVLTSDSDTTNGKFVFDLGYNAVSFPLYFTPLVKGGLNLKLTVTSTSDFPTSSTKFYIPVQNK